MKIADYAWYGSRLLPARITTTKQPVFSRLI